MTAIFARWLTLHDPTAFADHFWQIQFELNERTGMSYYMTSASIRRGCIELALDIVGRQEGTQEAGPDTGSAQAAGSSLLPADLAPADWMSWLYLQPPRDAEVLVQVSMGAVWPQGCVSTPCTHVKPCHPAFARVHGECWKHMLFTCRLVAHLGRMHFI